MYYLCITYVKPIHPTILMAKVIIHDIPLQEAAKILAQTGITLDKHQLPDGTYRAYVRKDKMPLFLSNNLKPTQLWTGNKFWKSSSRCSSRHSRHLEQPSASTPATSSGRSPTNRSTINVGIPPWWFRPELLSHMTPRKNCKIQDENLFRFIAFGGIYLLRRWGHVLADYIKFTYK